MPPLTDAGALAIAKLVMGDAQTIWGPASSGSTPTLGVGDSTTAFAKAQTDLQAATNKFRKLKDSGYPTRSGSTVTVRATYATSEANYAWQEWGVFNAAAAGDMLQRKVESLGSKTSAQSWQFTVDLAIQA